MKDGEGNRVVWQGFGYLLASQVITRMVTFTVNVLVARTLAPDDYGVFAVQFHLITTGRSSPGEEMKQTTITAML
eukprot:jgi/Pico_ML_1/54179/g4591.t1